MTILRFLISRIFLINLGISLVVLAIIFWGTIKSLDIYTKHGEIITIPDLQGLTVDQAKDVLKNKSLRYEINDSSSFIKDKAPYTILSQDPEPNAKAKENRTIYISVNARFPRKVAMPNLIDQDFELATQNLKLLKLEMDYRYEPDPEFNTFNVVLDQQYPGMDSTIAPGTEIHQGDTVFLLVSEGGDGATTVPDLFGATMSEAKDILQEYYLSMGIVHASGIEDSAKAVIYKQVPPFHEGEEMEIRVGEFIDVWLTEKDPLSMPQEDGMAKDTTETP